MKHLLPFLLGFSLFLASACSADLEPGQDDGGGHGGEGGGGGEDPSTSPSAASAGATTGAGGGYAATCDDQGTCGNLGSGCVGCAVRGPCAEAYGTCLDSKACVAFSECVSGCTEGKEGCLDACVDQHPEGAAEHGELTDCVVCEACAGSCAEQATSCGE